MSVRLYCKPVSGKQCDIFLDHVQILFHFHATTKSKKKITLDIGDNPRW